MSDEERLYPPWRERRFCGDCKKFRQYGCTRVDSIGRSAKGADGHRYWLHYPKDYADNCEGYDPRARERYKIKAGKFNLL